MTEQSYRLTFTDGHRLELDRTLGELMENAQKVLDTQGRLRSLLRASQAVIEQLDLPVVLRRIVEAAVELVGARYGALGVLAPDGSLEHSIHVGTPPERGEALDQLAPLEGFLDVPLRVRGEVFGNLFLSDAAAGEFTADDEDLLSALAATAGSAIDNARLFSETQRRQRWSSALAEVTAALVSDPPESPLDLIVERVLVLAEADLVGLVRETSPESMIVDTATGPHAAEVRGLVFASAGTITSLALESAQPIVVPSAVGTPERPLVLGPTVVIPMITARSPRGALIVSRGPGSHPFSQPEVAFAAEFAAQASVALELAAARVDQQRLLVLEDRSRIARDLHDHVIQRLFAAGLSLQSAGAQVSDPGLRSRIADQVQSLDEAIVAIRTAIFALTSEPDERPPLRHRVIELLTELGDLFEVSPRLAISGPVDLAVPDEVAEDLLAALREGLTNVARHAHAHEVTVTLRVEANDVTLSIEDDGVGIRDSGRRSGIANLERRAARRGGSASVHRRPHGGTVVTWRARIDADFLSADAPEVDPIADDAPAEEPDDPGIPAR